MSEPERAREPSMEEILASIRKIVTDNKNVRAVEDEAPAYADESAHQPAEVEDLEAVAQGETSSPHGEHEAMDEAEAASTVVEEHSAEEDALAIADAEARQRIGAVLGDSFEEEMGAQLARHLEPSEEVVEEPFAERAAAEAGHEEVVEESFAERAVPEAGYEEIAQPGREEGSFLERSEKALDAAFRVETAGEPAADARDVAALETEEPESAEEPATMEEAEAMEEPAGMMEPVGRDEETRLLSSPTDASVSSTFASLEKFVQSSQSHSLGDMVSDTLRPLLKEWLDANLPPMVERLVREEIERVSRGRR